MALSHPQELFYSFTTGEQRLQLCYEVSMFDREIRKQRARKKHPEWSELEVMHEIIRQAFLPEPMPEWLIKQMQQRLDESRARQSAGLE
jgi:hypothetical protein